MTDSADWVVGSKFFGAGRLYRKVDTSTKIVPRKKFLHTITKMIIITPMTE